MTEGESLSARQLYRSEPGTGEAPKGPSMSSDGGYAYSGLPLAGVGEDSNQQMETELRRLMALHRFEYDNLKSKATVIKDIAADCWGALVFVIVTDFPAIKGGFLSSVGRTRILFVAVVFAINVFIQFILLYFIFTLLMLPDMLEAQNVYKYFTDHAFIDGALDLRQFHGLELFDKEEICGLALSQAVFVRVILFLWITTNVMEVKANLMKMSETMGLPVLPEGMDETLMLVDNVETDVHESWVICLNPASKFLLCAFIFIPKLVICVFLACAGCVWLMASGNIADLILNSLALAFVTQVDELIAVVFFPEFFLTDLTYLGLATQEVDLDEDTLTWQRVCSFATGSLVLTSVIVAVEMVVLFQPVIPNYNDNEIQAACAAFVSSQVPWCMPMQKNCFPEGI